MCLCKMGSCGGQSPEVRGRKLRLGGLYLYKSLRAGNRETFPLTNTVPLQDNYLEGVGQNSGSRSQR